MGTPRRLAALLALLPALLAAASPPAPAATDRPADLATIRLDLESGRAVLDLFDRKRATAEELERIARLAGNRAMIAKAGGFDPAATEAAFVASLGRAIAGERVAVDPFRFNLVRERLEATRTLVRRIEADPSGLARAVAGRLDRYAPPGVRVDVTVRFVLGGTSDGWAPTDEAFYIALHYFEDDVEGLKLLMSHELYHVVQSAARRATGYDRAEPSRAVKLMAAVMNEGTASVVGDATSVTGGRAYVERFRAKFERNLARIDSNVALFETLLYRAATDPTADDDRMYALGFSGAWDSPLYFVGYRMARVVERHRGAGAIAAAVGRDPREFFALYLEVARAHDDPEEVRFGPTFDRVFAEIGRTR